MRPLEGRNVALGVSGSIACYKAVDLASKLVQLGAEVDVMMTPAAREFVAPLTFAAITHRPVAESLFDPRSELLIDHVAIAERADVVIIAPATAQTIAKLALGLADDPISATVLATAAPVIVCPAMDANMYDSPATQANVETLASRGVTIAGPAEGRLASGLMGKGRLLETAELLGYVRMVLGRTGDMAGRRVVVSAGGDAGGDRPGPLHIKPVERQDGLRDCRGGDRPRGRNGYRSRAERASGAHRREGRAGR